MEQVAPLPGVKLIYQCWGKVTMPVNASNHTRMFSVPIGSIISDKSFTDDANPSHFFRVERIATVM